MQCPKTIRKFFILAMLQVLLPGLGPICRHAIAHSSGKVWCVGGFDGQQTLGDTLCIDVQQLGQLKATSHTTQPETFAQPKQASPDKLSTDKVDKSSVEQSTALPDQVRAFGDDAESSNGYQEGSIQANTTAAPRDGQAEASTTQKLAERVSSEESPLPDQNGIEARSRECCSSPVDGKLAKEQAQQESSQEPDEYAAHLKSVSGMSNRLEATAMDTEALKELITEMKSGQISKKQSVELDSKHIACSIAQGAPLSPRQGTKGETKQLPSPGKLQNSDAALQSSTAEGAVKPAIRMMTAVFKETGVCHVSHVHSSQ